MPYIREDEVKTRTVKGYRQTQYGYNPPTRTDIDSSDYDGRPVVRIRSSGPPVQGNHRDYYPYAASGYTLTADSPRIVRYVDFQNFGSDAGSYEGVSSDTTHLSHLSCQEQSWTFNGNYPDIMYPNMLNETITGALNNLAENSVDLGAAIGEGRQTVDMFANTAFQIGRGLLAAKNGRWGSIPGILGMNKRDVLNGKFAANRWLEYQYGWKPLFQDLHDFQQKSHEVLLQDYILKGSKSTSSSNFDTWGTDEVRTLKSTLSVRTEVKAKITNKQVHSISSWGLLNPAAIAWELVPFSFVVDWFMPVGNTLNALTATSGLTFLGGASTTKKTATYTYTGSKQGNGRYKQVLSPGYLSGDSWSFVRDLYFEFPRPGFYADVTPFSTARVANAAALLRQLL